VASFAGLLARRMQASDEQVKEYVSYISDAVARMDSFLVDLLAYAQVTKNKNSVREIDSEIVVEWALMNLRRAIEETGAQVTYEALPDINADQAQMAQVFQNLIGNALKYRSELAPRVHVSARQQGEEWIFCVEDNGIGIPVEQRESIFGMFKRLHGRDVPGTGLGLAICKRIVENHGGRIWVESELGAGSKFFFTVPA
jgi:light-regulated signal transduction histidine kinase (bacteriophytochrome)